MTKIHSICDKKIIGENHRLTVYEPEELKYPQPILAIHGMWGTSRRWENYGNFFSKRGFLFIAPDLRHHHQGNQFVKELGETSVNDYIADIKKLIETIPPPIIFGHSMGGLIAQKITSYNLSSKTVLLNSAPPAGVSLYADFRYQLSVIPYLPQILLKKSFKPSFKTFSRYVMNGMPEESRKSLYQSLVYESGQAAWDIKYGKIEVNFNDLACPMLIIGCEKDRIVPPKVAEDIGKKIRHCDYNVWTYPQFAHWIQLESGWEEPAQHILEWIK